MKKRFLKFSNAPKITSRVMRLRDFTNVAYKTDGGDEFKDLLESIDKKMGEFKKATTEEAEKAALKEVKAIIEFTNTEFEKKWKEKHDELIKKNATIEEVQNELKEMKMKMGRLHIPSEKKKVYVGDLIEDAILENKEAIMGAKLTDKTVINKAAEVKNVANIASANLTGTGNNYVTYLDWQPGMEPTDQFRFRSLFRVIQSETDFVRFPRANTPIGEGSFNRQTEAAAKQQVDRDYTMIDLTLKPMAGYSIVSRQSLRNIVFLQSWLPTSMMEQLMDQEDTDFANTLVAAATGSTSTTGFTNSSSAIDKLIIYITRQRQAKYVPNFIATDPVVWGNIIGNKESNAGYNLPNIVTVTADGTTRVLGIPLIPVNWLTGNRMLMGDSRRGAIIQSEGLTLRQSDSHSTIFTTNEIAFLLERTENFATFRPDAFTTAVLS